MFREIKQWFTGKRRFKKTACRPSSKVRPGLETLEKREVLSAAAAAPTYLLTNGNLYQKTATAKTLIDSGVQSYQTDSHGHVALLETTGVLKYYTAGSLTTIDSGVSTYNLNQTGALLELDTFGDLERYTPTAGATLIYTGVQQVAFTSTGRIYVLRSNGVFLGSSDGLPGDYQQLDTGVQQFLLTSKGRVYVLESGGAFLGSSDGLPGSFTLLDFNVQSIGLDSTGKIDALQSNGLLLTSSTGLAGSFTIIGRNVNSLDGTNNGTAVVDDWFSENLDDPGVAAVARKDFATDGAITRKDMLGLFAQAETGGTITAAELQSLRAVVDNAAFLNIPAYVQDLGQKTVEGDPADSTYQGQRLATLVAGSPSGVLKALVNKWFLGLDHPAAAGPYYAVGGALFGKSGPLYSDVKQGEVGDCWLEASLAEVAARSPSDIKSMFIANGDDTWTVRFFNNGVADYVTVDNQLPGAGTLYDQPVGGVLWVALAEKAFAQENASGWLTTAVPGQNSYGALNGGDPSLPLSVIAGLSGQDNFVDAGSVASAWQQGGLVVLSTGFNRANAALVPDHSYAVLNYNATTDVYTLFNPWGINGGYSGQYYPGLINIKGASLAADFDLLSQGGPSSEAAMASFAGTTGDAVFLALSARQHENNMDLM